MSDSISMRAYQELQRCLLRVEKLYDGIIINGKGEDSFQSPKDYVKNFFRSSLGTYFMVRFEKGKK